eukprot:297386_1
MGLWDWVKSTTKNVVDTVMHPVLAVQEALGVAKAGENVGKSMESASRTAARSVDHATDKTTESLSQMTTTALRFEIFKPRLQLNHFLELQLYLNGNHRQI